MKNVFLISVMALSLAACTRYNNTATTTADPVTVSTTDRADAVTPTAGQHLDATVAAVQTYNGDITAIPGYAATSTIDTWINLLDDNDNADKVTANLTKLRDELNDGDINGPLAGMLMITLAEDATQVIGGSGNAATSALVSSLRAGGKKLTNAATSGSDFLSQTLGAVRSAAGDITTLPASAAVSNINSWIGKLRGMDGTDEIVEDLTELKEQLGAREIDGSEVADLLQDLAEETREIGKGNKSLEVLAYALEAGYWRLK